MENLCSIYRFIVLSPAPYLSRSIKRPGLPRMELLTNGTRFSHTEIPNRKFPNFFVNGKRTHSLISIVHQHHWPISSAAAMGQILHIGDSLYIEKFLFASL